MQWRLIDERVEFKCYHDWRLWFVNDKYHREDGGPTYENVISGHCQWCEHGVYMRTTKCNSG